ncbi:MAG TPA: hypothetical protein VGL50_07040 [Steroidobacteraceae bacterium]|jgi:hypothetical protein
MRLLPAALLVAACLALACPAAQAAGFWPYKSTADKNKRTGITLHGATKRDVKPLGNQLRVVKPIGANRKPPRTILAKKP